MIRDSNARALQGVSLQNRSRLAMSNCLLWIAAIACIVLPAWRSTAVADGGAVWLIGSSSMNGAFGHVLAKDFAQLGFKVTRRGYTSAGLARPDFRDVRDLIAHIPISNLHTRVLLYFGGNDAQSIWLRPEERKALGAERPWLSWNDERWSAIYEARAKELIDTLCARNAQQVVVVAPADVKRAGLQARLPRIRASLRRATGSTACGRYVSTAGDVNHFSVHSHVLRTRDGVHMTRTGALRVWQRVRDQVVALFSEPHDSKASPNKCGPAILDTEPSIRWSHSALAPNAIPRRL
jgi:hypothetical protein